MRVVGTSNATSLMGSFARVTGIDVDRVLMLGNGLYYLDHPISRIRPSDRDQRNIKQPTLGSFKRQWKGGRGNMLDNKIAPQTKKLR